MRYVWGNKGQRDVTDERRYEDKAQGAPSRPNASNAPTYITGCSRAKADVLLQRCVCFSYPLKRKKTKQKKPSAIPGEMLGCNVAPANGQLMGSRAAPLAPERRQIKAVIAALCTQRARGRFVCALRARLETGLQAYWPDCSASVNTRTDANLFQPASLSCARRGRLVIKKKEILKTGSERRVKERGASPITPPNSFLSHKLNLSHQQVGYGSLPRGPSSRNKTNGTKTQTAAFVLFASRA